MIELYCIVLLMRSYKKFCMPGISVRLTIYYVVIFYSQRCINKFGTVNNSSKVDSQN